MSEMKWLRVAVVGAGGVGGYLAAKLEQACKADVTLFARGEHLEAIEKEGLQVEDAGERFTVHPCTKPEAGTRFDAVFFAIKAYDLAGVCQMVEPFTDSRTLLVPLLNGVDHSRTLMQYLHEGIFCDGCVHVISHLQRPGFVVRKNRLFYLIFGCETGGEKAEALAEVLNESGLRTKLSPDARYDCWKKYLFIATFATLTTYYDLPMAEVYASHREAVEGLLEEIRAVANALGVPIGDADIAKVHRQAEQLPPGAKTSMQRDFEAGRKSELETLSSYIVEAAEANGVAVPLMKKYYLALRRRSEV